MAPYGDGHINDTYLLTRKSYILQKINTNIFKDTKGLMENIANVTDYLRKQIKKAGGNPDRETLTVIKTKNGKNYYEASDGGAYRIYKFIDKALSYNQVENSLQQTLSMKQSLTSTIRPFVMNSLMLQ